MVSLASTFYGALFGVVGFCVVVGKLDEMFRPYPDDMQMWLLYALPAGVIFGGISGWIVGLTSRQRDQSIAELLMFISLCLAAFHWILIDDSKHRLSTPLFKTQAIAVYAFAQYGPGLVWSLILFGVGVYIFLRQRKAAR